jgi:hypothetical protein
MKFTIRDLLWLTVVVALGVAWALRERTLQTELERLDRLAAVQTEAARAAQQVLKSNGLTVNARRMLPNSSAPAPKPASD